MLEQGEVDIQTSNLREEAKASLVAAGCWAVVMSRGPTLLAPAPGGPEAATAALAASPRAVGALKPPPPPPPPPPAAAPGPRYEL